MSRCNNCNSYCNNTCTPCDCINQYKGKCVFYNGVNLTCIDVTKGDNYDDIIAAINTAICDLQTPSGISTVVTGCDSNIEVSSVTSGTTTTYTVCLNSDITDEIATNTTDIADLQTCVQAGVLDVTSSTLDISVTDSTDCGRVLNIEIPTPTGTPTYDGIIYNNTSKNGTTGSTGDKLLKSFNWDYITNNVLAEDDEIRFVATGQIKGDGTNVDAVKIQIYNNATSTVIQTDKFTGFPVGDVTVSWKAEGELVATDVAGGEALYNVHLHFTTKVNGTKSSWAGASDNINVELTGIDFSDLSIFVIYEHNSTSTATDNFARKLMVEVRKKI